MLPGEDPDEHAEESALVPEDGDPEDEELSGDEGETSAVGAQGGQAEDEDSSDDDMDDTSETGIGEAPHKPPEGFVYAQPPNFDSEIAMQSIIGKYILQAWETSKIRGWFRGKVVSNGLSPRDLKKTPTANFVVLRYDRKETKNKHLHGMVASTLTASKYGSKEWWVLLEKA